MKKMLLLLLLGSFSVLYAQPFQIVLDFESDSSSRNFQYFGSSLEPQLTRVVDNPLKAGQNTSPKTLEFIKPVDAQTWAGAFCVPNLNKPINLSNPGSQLCIKVLMRHPGNIALKLEAATDGANNWIQQIPVPKANEWVEVCLDPSLPSLEDPKLPAVGHQYARLVIFVDFGLNGPSVADTTFLDDVFVKVPSNECRTVYSFETDSLATSFQYFGSAIDGQKNMIVNNPHKTGINTSDKVAEFVKPADAQTWAGAFANPALSVPLDLTHRGTQLCMKVWMDHPGNVALKLEGSTDNGPNWLAMQPVGKANEWVEICFDPSLASLEDPKKPAIGFHYKTIVLFFDFGKSGAESAATSYFDDLRVCRTAAPAVVPVRFAVDMRPLAGTFQKVFVSGTFNDWSEAANPLQDPDGDQIWTAEIPLAPGSIEYKFQVDNWKSQESLLPGSTCTRTTDGFTNRTLVIPSSGITVPDTICWNSCYACGESIRLTIQLGAQHIQVAPTGLFIAGGGNFGVPGDYPLLDPDKDGVYAITIERPKGFTSFYTFTNGNCADYSCKENIAGQPCANPDNYNDRKMGPFNRDTTISTCFGQCTTSAQCGTVTKRKVTLKVNMTGYTKPFVNVYVSGSFNNWSANENRLFDDDGDNIYTTELQLADGSYEFKYQLDGWSAQEEFKGGESCTKTTGIYTNRFLEVIRDTMLPTVCFNACTACTATATPEYTEVNLFSVFPNPTDQQLYITIHQPTETPLKWTFTDVTGRQYPVSWNDYGGGQYVLSTKSLPSGIYWLRAVHHNQYAIRRVVVAH